MNEVKAIDIYKTVKQLDISDTLVTSFVDFLDVSPLTVKTYKA